MESIGPGTLYSDVERTPPPHGQLRQTRLLRDAVSRCLREPGNIDMTDPVTFAQHFLTFEKNNAALSDLPSLITERDVRALFASVEESVQSSIRKRGSADRMKAARGACGELYLHFALREMMERVPLAKEQQIEVLSKDKSTSFELDGGDHRPTHRLSFEEPFNCHIVKTETDEQKAEFDAALVVGDDGTQFYLFDICMSNETLREKITLKDRVFVRLRAELRAQGIQLWKFHVIMCNRPATYVHPINEGVFIIPMQRHEEVSKLAYATVAIQNPDELNGDLLKVYLAHLRSVQDHPARQRA